MFDVGRNMDGLKHYLCDHKLNAPVSCGDVYSANAKVAFNTKCQ